jgi:hypothetical protein
LSCSTIKRGEKSVGGGKKSERKVLTTDNPEKEENNNKFLRYAFSSRLFAALAKDELCYPKRNATRGEKI